MREPLHVLCIACASDLCAGCWSVSACGEGAELGERARPLALVLRAVAHGKVLCSLRWFLALTRKRVRSSQPERAGPDPRGS